MVVWRTWLRLCGGWRRRTPRGIACDSDTAVAPNTFQIMTATSMYFWLAVSCISYVVSAFQHVCWQTLTSLPKFPVLGSVGASQTAPTQNNGYRRDPCLAFNTFPRPKMKIIRPKTPKSRLSSDVFRVFFRTRSLMTSANGAKGFPCLGPSH